ncbi:MAG: hypothetical protein GY719_04705 [bacterium]|nr:hypothetical protein [bacterium]
MDLARPKVRTAGFLSLGVIPYRGTVTVDGSAGSTEGPGTSVRAVGPGTSVPVTSVAVAAVPRCRRGGRPVEAGTSVR